MPKAIDERRTVSIVGPGRFGSVLALTLARAGWDVEGLVVRSGKQAPSDTVKLARRVKAKIGTLGETPLGSHLVWIAVPDDMIAAVAKQLAAGQEWRGKKVFHSSGALTSDVLSPLRARGASVASVHPGMTFVRRSTPRLMEVPFGVEGDAAAVRMAREVVRDLGGRFVPIGTEDKVLYHAFGTFASPLMIALLAAIEQVGMAAGIRRSQLKMMAEPLLRQTLNNYFEYGAEGAFSGPLVRGDVATVRRHLAALRKVPEAREAYASLAQLAVRFLPVKNRKDMERELNRIV